MTLGEIVLTLVALVTVVLVPGAFGAATGMRRGSGLVVASIVGAVIAALWAVYWIALAQPHHLRHAVLFAVLAVVMLVAASFSRPQEPAAPAYAASRRR